MKLLQWTPKLNENHRLWRFPSLAVRRVQRSSWDQSIQEPTVVCTFVGGAITPPCGVPIVVGLKTPFSITPAARNFSTKFRMLPSCLWFISSRVASAFVVDLYVGLPPILVDWRTSWDLTGQAHEPFSRGESTTTLTLERRLTVFAAARRSMRLNRRASPFRGSWHFV